MNLIDLHEKYYEKLRRFILSVVKDNWVADDLVQETFVRAGEKYSDLRDSSRLSAWIFKIAWNLCNDHFNRASYKKTDEFHDHISKVRILEHIEHKQMEECIHDKMERLPDKYKLPLMLFDLEGFTHAEIADILGVSVENAKVRLHRGRKELKKILASECEFERDNRNVFVCIPKSDLIDNGGSK